MLSHVPHRGTRTPTAHRTHLGLSGSADFRSRVCVWGVGGHVTRVSARGIKPYGLRDGSRYYHSVPGHSGCENRNIKKRWVRHTATLGLSAKPDPTGSLAHDSSHRHRPYSCTGHRRRQRLGGTKVTRCRDPSNPLISSQNLSLPRSGPSRNRRSGAIGTTPSTLKPLARPVSSRETSMPVPRLRRRPQGARVSCRFGQSNRPTWRGSPSSWTRAPCRRPRPSS